MSTVPTDFEMRLLDMLQDPLPIQSHPFEAIAQRLGADEATVLERAERLRAAGWIRRFRGRIDYRALGRLAVLVTTSVPEDRLASVAERINALSGVSHNYLRDHEYNLWFTLQDRSRQAIEQQVEALSAETGLQFHTMEALRVFKLDVRFRLTSESPTRLASSTPALPRTPVTLTDLEHQLLRALQEELPILARPFAKMAGPDVSESQVLQTVTNLQDSGVLRQIAAMVDYRRLGYVANGMVCLHVKPTHVQGLGEALAALESVSHCYERRTFAGFPYNLFAMMHARSIAALHEMVDPFTQRPEVHDGLVLHTLREFKKQPVRITPDRL